MKIIEVIIGVLIAVICTLIGGFLYVQLVLGMSFFSSYNLLIQNGFFGKIIAMGSLLNIPAVYLMLNKQKINIGKGIILGLILLVIVSQIV